MPISRTSEYADYQAALYTQSKANGGASFDTEGLEKSLFGKDGFTFHDLLDVINPLQHLPVVSTLYRKFTGDEISPASRVAGGGLFGGVIGLAGSLFNVAVEKATGADVGGHVVALVTGEDIPSPTADKVMTASVPARPDAASGSDDDGLPAARFAQASQGYKAASAITHENTGWLFDLRP